MPALIEAAGFSYLLLYLIHCESVLVEKYEKKNSVSHRYVVGNGRSILTAFLDSCGYSSVPCQVEKCGNFF